MRRKDKQSADAAARLEAGRVAMPAPPVPANPFVPPSPPVTSTASAQGQQQGEDNKGQGDSDGDGDVFAGMEDFARALLEAQMFRDRVQRGEVTDAERREQAAQWAMKLGQMLQIDESSDDEN